jgi:hypothetical protein
MILIIFFLILVGMLLGLSLLAFNLQRFLEIIIVYVFLYWLGFIWNLKPVLQMVFKNLTAHRMRNKMTSIIFSISLGFLIFLIVVYNLQIKSIQLTELQSRGSYFLFSSNDYSQITPQLFDPIIKANIKYIDEFTYITPDMSSDSFYKLRRAQVSDLARINILQVSLRGV